MVAEDLTENTDPEMLARCSEFFMEHGQFDKAVELAVLGKKVISLLLNAKRTHHLIRSDIAVAEFITSSASFTRAMFM